MHRLKVRGLEREREGLGVMGLEKETYMGI